ncbi:MAG: glycosyltransferase family 1 protein [Lachnospiraceae bacterium]|jgi:rhamnosyltransferase|nr:DUF1972 domain-containing protein [uncultured Acetatifactor sp.]MCI9219390.1 glycosyltransferase family 1 protein [Lachnospiraceae bacterium]
MQHVFIVGAKGFVYGGYETFLDKLTECHQHNDRLKYHIACKANGPGMTDEEKLKGAQIVSEQEYIYHNAHCFKVRSLELGSAQAILYDIKALWYCVNYIRKNKISHPIVYMLSSRVGPVMGYFARKIHRFGGKYCNNPDGREALRQKYTGPVRKYWAISERKMVKHSDLVICDSINIEKYIQNEYRKFQPKTAYIAYGADTEPSDLADDAPEFTEWMKKFKLTKYNYYISVGRFVPENNFETMIREFMNSKSRRDFVVIATEDKRFLSVLDQKLHFSQDKRIKLVGTVYNQPLLKKIRENAYGYLHGHEVGGTNPSLLEALGSTNLNLLYDVGFNREVGRDTALYWIKKEGDLAKLIDRADAMRPDEVERKGAGAKEIIRREYNWKFISDRYAEVFMNM